MTTVKGLGNSYVKNGMSADMSGIVPDISADTYYEVVRLIEGKLLFLPEHLQRLQTSLSGSGIGCPDHQEIEESLRLLIAENPFQNGNIRICLQHASGSKAELQCYYISYVYPDKSMYKNGVRLISYPHIRPNPGIKKWDHAFRNSVGQYIREHKVYEALLLNPEDQITEGSRSNVFFIDRDGQVITVPEKQVLPGITRRYVLQIATEEGIPVQERSISMDELDGLSAAFISGTSPKVLPVKQIDDYPFDVNHPVLRLLMDQFDRLIKKKLTLLGV
jgi:branched-chain amino acid aminotransferase